MKAEEINSRMLLSLNHQINDKNSDINKYTFTKKNENISRDEILHRLRSFYISNESNTKHYYIGHEDGDYRSEKRVKIDINYDVFIDIIVKHYQLNIVNSCSKEEFYNLVCQDFLMCHFEDKKSVDLINEVNYSKNSKEFKKRILNLMKDNIVHWKRESNGGQSGISKDGFHSYYHGSVFVNDFKIITQLHQTICHKNSINFELMKKEINKNNYWDILYEYNLFLSGKTFPKQTTLFDFA